MELKSLGQAEHSYQLLKAKTERASAKDYSVQFNLNICKNSEKPQLDAGRASAKIPVANIKSNISKRVKHQSLRQGEHTSSVYKVHTKKAKTERASAKALWYKSNCTFVGSVENHSLRQEEHQQRASGSRTERNTPEWPGIKADEDFWRGQTFYCSLIGCHVVNAGNMKHQRTNHRA